MDRFSGLRRIGVDEISYEIRPGEVQTPLAALLALGVNQPIADGFGRTRPCNALHEVVVLHCNTDAGLPSDHAVIAGAATAGLWLVSRRLGTITAIVTIAMAFTRVYIGAHYPADVLAGIALGIVVAFAGYALARPLLQRVITAPSRTPARPLVRQAPTTGDSKPFQVPEIGAGLR